MLKSCIKAILLLSALMLLAGCTAQAQYMKIDNDAKLQMEHLIKNHPDYTGKLEVAVKHGKVTFTIVDTGQPMDEISRLTMGGWAANEWHKLMEKMDGRKNWKGDLMFMGRSICHYSIDKKGKVDTNVYGNDSI